LTDPETLERFARWLRYPPEVRGRRRRRAMSEGSITVYSDSLRRYLEFLEGQEPSAENAWDWVQQLEAGGLSPRTVGRHIYALRAFFVFLGRDLDLGPPAYARHIPRWLTSQEWLMLVTRAEAPLHQKGAPVKAKERALFLRAALFVYGGAGLRLAEGLGLRRDDVNPQGYLRVMSKGGHEDLVPVEDAVLTAIREWLATHRSQWVFPGRHEREPLDRRAMQGAMRKLMKEAGLKDVRRPVHTLRHTMGADLRKRGADLRDIQQVLRHTDISTTTIYTQMANEELRQRLPRRFGPPEEAEE
jgi:integrase/recombinase XerD